MEKGDRGKKEKKRERNKVSKGRNTVIRNGLCIAKKSNQLLGEEKGGGRFYQCSYQKHS